MSSISIRPLDDEWWTTAMVCSYLKLKRRALWDIRRDAAKAFPAAIKPGGKVNLFRAEDVRQWVAKRRPSSLPTPQRQPEPATKVKVAQRPDPAASSLSVVAPSTKHVQRKRAATLDDRQLGLF